MFSINFHEAIKTMTTTIDGLVLSNSDKVNIMTTASRDIEEKVRSIYGVGTEYARWEQTKTSHNLLLTGALKEGITSNVIGSDFATIYPSGEHAWLATLHEYGGVSGHSYIPARPLWVPMREHYAGPKFLETIQAYILKKFR